MLPHYSGEGLWGGRGVQRDHVQKMHLAGGPTLLSIRAPTDGSYIVCICRRRKNTQNAANSCASVCLSVCLHTQASQHVFMDIMQEELKIPPVVA